LKGWTRSVAPLVTHASQVLGRNQKAPPFAYGCNTMHILWCRVSHPYVPAERLTGSAAPTL